MYTAHIVCVTGTQQHEVMLPYKPYCPGLYTVSASHQHVYVIDTDNTKLHIHSSLTGQYLGCLTTHHLGLNDSYSIYRVSDAEGGYVHLYVYDNNTDISGLRSYQIL